MKRLLLASMLVVLLVCSPAGGGEDSTGIPLKAPWSIRIGESFIRRHPDGATYDSAFPGQKWNYEQGLMLVALHRLWQHSGEQKYFEFVRKNLDRYVDPDGRIRTYDRTDYNLDNIAPGRALLAAYEVTRLPQYRAAADTLRRQLREQPRTNEGGFWHKQIYPFQMWLDGLFMAQPFYTAYAVETGEDSAFNDILNQFRFIARHTHDPRTGLYYHGWDESRQQRWANPATGCSPVFWGRAIGWFTMALVDVLDLLPPDQAGRRELAAILQGLAEALLKYQDTATGLWHQVVDQGGREGNYLESSASAMFAYSFARGAGKGYLDRKFRTVAERAFAGLLKAHVTVDGRGFVNLHNTCAGAGLGGNPYRDGSYQYYISVQKRTNDMKGLGPLLLAATELENHEEE